MNTYTVANSVGEVLLLGVLVPIFFWLGRRWIPRDTRWAARDTPGGLRLVGSAIALVWVSAMVGALLTDAHKQDCDHFGEWGYPYSYPARLSRQLESQCKAVNDASEHGYMVGVPLALFLVGVVGYASRNDAKRQGVPSAPTVADSLAFTEDEMNFLRRWAERERVRRANT